MHDVVVGGSSPSYGILNDREDRGTEKGDFKVMVGFVG